MKVTISEPKSWQKIIDIEIPNDDVEKEFELKLKKHRKEVKLPGFRQGKVPAKLLKTRFGPSIRAEVLDDLINKSYRDACEENKIIPVSEAKISDLKSEENTPITFKVEIEVDPEFSITGYKKLKIKANPKKIKDADVNESLVNILERMAEFKDVERVSKKGDTISVEYVSVSVDGEVQDGLVPAPQLIELGKGTLKDFDKGLIGLKADDSADILVKFPDDYYKSEVSGKSALISVKVKKVQEKVTPVVDEELLKKMGDFSDEAALKAKIREDMEVREKDLAKTEAHGKAIDAIIEKNEFEVPPSRVEYYIDKVIEEQLKYNPQEKEPDREEVAKKYREIGIKAIKRQRIIEFIAKTEKVKATQDEVDVQIQKIANQYQQPFEEVKKTFRKNGTTTRIREDIKEYKTLDCLIGETLWEEKLV